MTELAARSRHEISLPVTIEDPFDEDDWSTWSAFTGDVGGKFQVVGDDLTVTNPTKIQKAVDEKSCNCLLLKVCLKPLPKATRA